MITYALFSMEQQLNSLSQLTCSQSHMVLQRFVAAWHGGGQPPEIAGFLEQDSQQTLLTLHELIKIDLEYRYRVFNFPKQLDDYILEFSLLSTSLLPTELIYEEFYFRLQAGLQVDIEDYLNKYPQQASELAQLLTKIPTEDLAFTGQRQHQDHYLSLKIGQRIDDFDLVMELGRGSFARVFKARQVSMQRIVALKVSANTDNEPQTLAQLDHPYLLRVYDQRILPQLDLRLMYVEYIPGGTLKEVITLARQTPVNNLDSRVLQESIRNVLQTREERLPEYLAAVTSWQECVCILGVKLATALEYTHQQGVLHLDIKPANILLSAEGEPKLADFNTCFQRNDDPIQNSQAGGSLAYMSPEQLQIFHSVYKRHFQSLSEKSDIYSLGLTLTELLSTQRLFLLQAEQKDLTEQIDDMLYDRKYNLPAIDNDDPGIQELQTIFHSCMQFQEHKRPSAGQLARQLGLWLNPRAYALVYAKQLSENTGIMVAVLVFAVFLPNLLASWFNYYYNSNEIISLLPEASRALFWNIQTVINLVAYPLGIAFFIYLSRPLIHRQKISHTDVTRESLQDLRNRCLNLGHYYALIGIFLWSIAGIAYPLAIHFTAGAMPMQNYPHFFASLFLCGVIISVYPFFLTTAFCLRRIYPKLLLESFDNVMEIRHLSTLQRRVYIYLGLAGLVPLFAILALILIEVRSKLALVLLSGASLFGLGLIIVLFRRILADSDDLRSAINSLATSVRMKVPCSRD